MSVVCQLDVADVVEIVFGGCGLRALGEDALNILADFVTSVAIAGVP